MFYLYVERCMMSRALQLAINLTVVVTQNVYDEQKAVSFWLTQPVYRITFIDRVGYRWNSFSNF